MKSDKTCQEVVLVRDFLLYNITKHIKYQK